MIQIFLIPLSSLLLIFSFPNFNLWILSWVGLIPLFFFIDGKKASGSFLAAYATGALFFLGTVYWLIHVTLPGMIGVVLYLAAYFGVFGLIASRALGRPSYISLIAVPSAWVACEYARSHLLGGFGWNLLSYSQSSNLLLIQIADIFGSYGVSFIVVLVNTALYFTIKDIRSKNYSTFYLAIAIGAVFLAVGYGNLRMNNVFTGERLKVSVVQGNIPQEKKWDPASRREIVDRYDILTTAAVKGSADLIVWPETSVPGFLQLEPDLSERISGIARGTHAHLLVGYPRQDVKSDELYYNSAALFDEYGKITAVYDKIHLVPFGEFIPARILFSFVEKFTKATIGDFSPGKERTVFIFNIERSRKGDGYNLRLVKKVAFSVMICFEDIFPDIARGFVNNGAGFLVNITNDAWFGNSSAPYQHVQNSIFRAVENRVNVIRAANSGVSCFIDQRGKVFGVVSVRDRDIFVDGYKTDDIVLTKTRTFYTAHGDIFAHLCIAIVTLFIIAFFALSRLIMPSILMGACLKYLQKVEGRISIMQIGAYAGNSSNDPIYNFIKKNTYAVKDPVCTAVLVEPVKHIFNQLVASYKGCSGLSFENVAISDKAGMQDFYRLDEGVKLNEGQWWFHQLGSLLPERMGRLWDNYEKDPTAKEFIRKHTVIEMVQCISFSDLIMKSQVDKIDFLQIDTEGYDYDIIRTIDYKNVRPSLINYERVLLLENEAKCRQLLIDNGYILFNHGQDTLCITNSVKFLPLIIAIKLCLIVSAK